MAFDRAILDLHDFHEVHLLVIHNQKLQKFIYRRIIGSRCCWGAREMTRSNWIALAIIAAVLILLIYFRAEVWFGIVQVFSWIGMAFLFLWSILKAIVDWTLGLLGIALGLATAALQVVVAFLMVIAAAIIGIGILVQLSLLTTGLLGRKLGETAKQIRELRSEFLVESGRAARDAAFLALIATSSALIAYMGTEDFLKQVSTIRFLAVGCIGLVLSKIFLFFPARIPKWSGIALTAIVIAGSTMFVAIRYQLADGTMNGFWHLRDVIVEPDNQLKLLLAAVIGMFALLTLLFPFTPNEWRQLLFVPRPQLESGEVVPALTQKEPALLEKKQS
jgi:hypothetical protein